MRCLSLFSGCGGLDLGLRNAGFQIVLSVDNDPHCSSSYKENFPEACHISDSISNLNEPLLREILDGKPIDLLAGGPPCPPFSKSRFYRKEKPRSLDDPKGLEAIENFLRIVKLAEPKVVLLENVPGFAYKPHASALNLVTSTLGDLGYSHEFKIMQAADFGVPQIRQRFFMLASKVGDIPFPEETHAKSAPPGLFDASKLPWVTCGDVLEDLDTEENADDTGHFAGGKHHQLLKEIPPGDNYLFFTEKRGHPSPIFEWRSRYWSFLLKLSPDLPSWTIQARRSNNMGPFHWRNRILRIPEIKRLQTFPDDWIIDGKIDEQWRQIGNAVPPRLSEQIGLQIHDHLSNAKTID